MSNQSIILNLNLLFKAIRMSLLVVIIHKLMLEYSIWVVMMIIMMYSKQKIKHKKEINRNKSNHLAKGIVTLTQMNI